MKSQYKTELNYQTVKNDMDKSFKKRFPTVNLTTENHSR